MIRKRCSACGAKLPKLGRKRGESQSRSRSLDEQRVPIVAYREPWREEWRKIFGR